MEAIRLVTWHSSSDLLVTSNGSKRTRCRRYWASRQFDGIFFDLSWTRFYCLWTQRLIICQTTRSIHQIGLSTPSSVISRPTCFSSSLRCCWQVGSAPFVRRRCDCLATSAPFTNIQTYLLTYLHLGVKRIDGMQCKSRQPAVLRTSPALCSFYDQPCCIYVRVNAKS